MLLSQAAEGSWMQWAVTCLVTNLHLVRFWHLATLVDAMVEITRHGLLIKNWQANLISKILRDCLVILTILFDYI